MPSLPVEIETFFETDCFYVANGQLCVGACLCFFLFHFSFFILFYDFVINRE